MPAVHSVLLNSDFVTTEVGTGCVHVAPGCGPEDYVVGQQNGIRPFNAVNVSGVYEGFEPFNGLLARKDDAKFIAEIQKQGGLVHQHDYEHEYPFGERSKEPVIYRTTKQWFFKVEGSSGLSACRPLPTGLILDRSKAKVVGRARKDQVGA